MEEPISLGPVAQARLTPGQKRIVELAAQRLTNKQIAARLGISPQTVKGQLSKVFTNMDLTSRKQLPEALQR